MKTTYDLMVPWLREVRPVSYDFIDRGWENPSLVRLAANEHPTVPTREVLRALHRGARHANRYPDSLKSLRALIGEVSGGFGPEWVLLGNGSNEILDMTFRSFLQPGDEIIQSVPCYGGYAVRCRVSGATPRSIPARDDFAYDVEALERAVSPRGKIMVLSNPNYPTGRVVERSVFERLAGCPLLLICDEAYIDYAGAARSMISLLESHPNMLISRTLSKAYGLAGMRFGYAIGHPDTIDIVSRVQMPWNISTLSAYGALSALRDQRSLARRRARIGAERERLIRALAAIPGITLFPSDANYVLLDATGRGVTSGEMVEALRDRYGVLVRESKPFGPRRGMVRVTVSSKGENNRCIQGFTRYFGEEAGQR